MGRLYRSGTDKKIAGICGGLAEAYSTDANLIRMTFVFVGLATGVFPLAIAYIVGWVLLPLGRAET